MNFRRLSRQRDRTQISQQSQEETFVELAQVMITLRWGWGWGGGGEGFFWISQSKIQAVVFPAVHREFRLLIVPLAALDQHRGYKGPPLTGTIRLL